VYGFFGNSAILNFTIQRCSKNIKQINPAKVYHLTASRHTAPAT
jgi:hypothetical protein